MDERSKWLMRQPTFWLGIAVTIAAVGIAGGLFSALVARYAAAFIAVCGTYGVTSGHLKSPPRIDLIDMSRAEREKIFAAHPNVRERFYLEHPELLLTAADAAHKLPGDERMPPPLPPAEDPPKK
ncbi:MAG TPA: hypothetical protein VF814_04645 [Casimicrobiaceae bacterium]